MKYTEKLRILSPLIKIAIILVLVIFVFIPSFYLFTFILLRWNEVYNEIFANPIIGNFYWIQIQRYILFSFKIAFSTVIIDLLFGIPLAYILARKRFFGKEFIEDLITLPLVIPTSGFGFATLITWTASESIISILGIKIRIDTLVPFINIPFLILLVHVSLTFPYIVKTLVASLIDLKNSLEIVSNSLGASSLTTFRKIVFPLVIPGIFSGSVLALARSLGETGATMIVSGVSITASIAIVRWEFENKLAPAAFIGALLICIALLIILPIEYFSSNKRGRRYFSRRILSMHFESKLVLIEKLIAKKIYWVKDIFSILFVATIIILPIFTLTVSCVRYWSSDPYTGRIEGSILYQLFGPSNYYNLILRSTITSFIASGISILLSIYIGILTIILIVKSKYGDFIRALLKIPLVVPTSALGLSMVLLWGPSGLNILAPSIWLIILTHIVFSVPVIVETGLASYREIGVDFYEDTARTLGATPYDVIETISIPMIKRGIISGGLLAFTHSLGETGATFLVMGNDTTISTLVVNMVEALAIPAALFASLLLISLSLLLLIIIRVISR